MDTKREYATDQESWNNQWIWSTSLVQWLTTESERIFWICGKPGSGKSTLVAYIVNSRRTREALKSINNDSYYILHFFCNYDVGKALANSVEGMLRLLLYQLADQSRAAKDRLQELRKAGRLKLESTEHLLYAACEAIAKCDTRICLFVDGLDECNDLVRLLQTFKALRERTGVKLCVASRPDAKISESLDIKPDILMQDYNSAGMYEYVSTKILEASATNLDIRERFSYELKADLVDKAEGIMLWFRYVVDHVIELYKANEADETITGYLSAVPVGLDGIYNRALSSIPRAHRCEAALLLYLLQKVNDLVAIADSWDSRAIGFGSALGIESFEQFWGMYDFIVVQVGDYARLPKRPDLSGLEVRMKLLIPDLVQVNSRRAEDTNLMGTYARFVHRTCVIFLERSDWVEQHMHEMVRERYTENFWLRLPTHMIQEAEKDGVMSSAVLKESLREIGILCGTDDDDASGRAIRQLAWKFLKNRRSYLLGWVQELFSGHIAALFSTSKSDPFVSKVSKKYFSWLLSQNKDRTLVEIPPVWKSRSHVLWTSLLVFVEKAQMSEEGGLSTYPQISQALQARLGTFAGMDHYRHKMKDWLLYALFEDPDIQGCRDLVTAITCNLSKYFTDRMSVDTPGTSQMEALMSAIVAWHVYTGNCNHEHFSKYICSMKDHGAQLDARDVCCILSHSNCIATIAGLLDALKVLVKSETSCLRMNWGVFKHTDKNEILLHWAQFSCYEHEDGFPKTKLLSALDSLVALGLDINASCYPGGTVLQAVLDDAVQPLSGRCVLYRKAKFVALVERGIDPTIVTARGTGLESARKFKYRKTAKMYKMYVDSFQDEEDDMKKIIEWLEHYMTTGCWPELPKSEDENGLGPGISMAMRRY